jgi:hypothetical protein
VDQVLDDLPRVRSLGAAHVLRAMRTHSDEQLAVRQSDGPASTPTRVASTHTDV